MSVIAVMAMTRPIMILATLLFAAGLTVPAFSPALADQSANQTSAPPSALSAQFTAFLTDVLAGRLPASGISDQMKSALTPAVIAQVGGSFAPLGKFQKLQFVRQDTVQGYQRYHYVAVFDKGTQGLMFVVDSNGNIAGFFKDQ
jgi:hypothetical protein